MMDKFIRVFCAPESVYGGTQVYVRASAIVVMHDKPVKLAKGRAVTFGVAGKAVEGSAKASELKKAGILVPKRDTTLDETE